MSGLDVQIAAPIGGRRKTIQITDPLTLGEILDRAISDGLIDPDEMGRVRTYVNQSEIQPCNRDHVVPEPGDYVLLYPTPQFETIAMAITTIVAALSPGVVTAAIGSTFGITSLAAAQAIYGLVALTELSALGAAGSLVARVLGGNKASTSATYGITGSSNTADPDGVCPVLLGKRRVVPRLAASTWTEAVGDDVYLRMLVQWSVGPVRLSDLRIGETPLSVFKDVEVQHRLTPEDPFPSLYDRVVREDTYGSLELVHDNGWVQRQTQKDTTLISIDLSWTSLAWNGKDPATVEIHFQYRPIDSGVWLDAPVGVGGVVTYRETKPQAFRRNVSWAVAKGQYDVRILRVTEDAGDKAPRLQDQVFWTCMRSFGEGRPVLGDNFALTALRIRATNQLNGQVAELNAIAEALIPTWDVGVKEFVGRDASSNPGDQMNWVARGPANARPLEGRVNVANFGKFAETCAAKGWKCDTIIESEMSVEQVLTLVALSGHALGTPWVEGLLTVAIDDERPAPAQVFSGRNVRNFSGAITFPEPLHAVNVSFYDAASGYQKEVRTVYADGYDASNATAIEAIHTDTKTDAAEAFVYGWRYIHQRTHRPETYDWDCDREGLVAPWGARVDVAHPRMLVGIRGTRIKQVLTREDDGYVTGFVIDEEVPMEEGTSYVLKAQRGSSIGLMSIVTVAGTTDTLTLVTPRAPAAAPVVGNHCVFGVAGNETLQALLVGVGVKADQTAHLTCIPYAPELLADGGVIPPWDPKVTPRSLSEPIATSHFTPTVRRAIDDETIARLANDPVPNEGVDEDKLAPSVKDAIIAAKNTADQAKEEASSAQQAANQFASEAAASSRELIDKMQAAILAASVGLLGSATDLQSVRASISSATGAAFAEIASQIDMATGPNSALARRLDTMLTKVDAGDTYLSVTAAALTYLSSTAAANTYLSQSTAQLVYQSRNDAAATFLTIAAAATTYLSQTAAGNTYLTQSSASSTYLSKSEASSTYLTASAASTTYLTTTAAASNYATQSTVSLVSSAANSKNRTFAQTSAPAALAVGDLWFDTDDANHPYQWGLNAAWNDIRDTAFIAADNAVLSTVASTYLTTTAAGNTYLTQASATATYLPSGTAASTYLTIGSASSTYLSQSAAGNTYLTQASAAANYETKSDLTANYLKISDASSTYLNQTSAANTYLKQADAASTYLSQSAAGSTYLTSTAAASTYLKTTDASSTYLSLSTASANYLTKADASSTYVTQASASANYLTQASAAANYASITTVNGIDAKVGNIYAGGYIRFAATAAPTGYDSQVAITASGTSGGNSATAGLFLKVKNGLSYIDIVASRTSFVADDGTTFAAFDGATKMLILDRIQTGGLTNLNFWTSGQLTNWWPGLAEQPSAVPDMPATKFDLPANTITAISTGNSIPFNVNGASATIVMQFMCTYQPQTSSQVTMRAGFMVKNTIIGKYQYMDESMVAVSTGSNAIYQTIIARCRIPSSWYTQVLPWLFNTSGDTMHVKSVSVEILQNTK
jgi:hypothetical protein